MLLPLFIAAFSVLAIYFHWHWSFSIFHYHLEKYVCYVFLVGGMLALLRRVWNATVWKVLDKIADGRIANEGKVFQECREGDKTGV